MEWVVIVRYSEIAVKGPSTRARMEALLARNISEALEANGLGGRVEILEGRLLIRDPSPDPRRVAEAASRVFGVKSASPAVEITFEKLEDLARLASEWFAPRVSGKVFMVRARRVGSHAFTSKDVERLIGSMLLERGGRGVNLESPEYTAYVEIRGDRAYLYDEVVEGPGGLPLGSEGPVLALFSGGFDSTMAAWLLMRRGAMVDLVYYDFGVRKALEIAVDVALTLARNWSYGHTLTLYRVDLTPTVRRASASVERHYRALVVRRAMMIHAATLALKRGYEALATGESVGQVASQTIRNIMLIGRSLPVPVLRPLAGSDKDEIVSLARRAGLYEKAARQIEVCGRGSTPTPHADPNRFEEEYSKLHFDPDALQVSHANLRRDISLEEALELLGG